MNFVIVILSVIIIVILFYFGYKSYFGNKNGLQNQVSLADNTKPVPDIVATNLSKPDATRFAYGVWMYVNTLNSPSSKSVIFSRNNDIVAYLDQSTSTLSVILNPDTSTLTAAASGSITIANESNIRKTNSTKIDITNNFPLQKWVHLVVSVDNNVADIYLDGKLVKSVQVKQVAPRKDDSIKFGLGFDIYIDRFKRWIYPLAPQEVWNEYYSGSGSRLNLANSKYNVALSILKDDVISKKYTLY
jgi:hypothetical protein